MAIEAVRKDRATVAQVNAVLAARRRYAELGRGLARSEARRALAPNSDAGPGNHTV